MGLGSRVAVAVAVASSCSSDLIPAWKLPYAEDAALKRKPTNQRTKQTPLAGPVGSAKFALLLIRVWPSSAPLGEAQRALPDGAETKVPPPPPPASFPMNLPRHPFPELTAWAVRSLRRWMRMCPACTRDTQEVLGEGWLLLSPAGGK